MKTDQASRQLIRVSAERRLERAVFCGPLSWLTPIPLEEQKTTVKLDSNFINTMRVAIIKKLVYVPQHMVRLKIANNQATLKFWVKMENIPWIYKELKLKRRNLSLIISSVGARWVSISALISLVVMVTQECQLHFITWILKPINMIKLWEQLEVFFRTTIATKSFHFMDLEDYYQVHQNHLTALLLMEISLIQK